MRSLFALYIITLFASGPIMAKNHPELYGYVEKVTLIDKNITLSAKLDTGAKSASLHALHIKEITKNGIPYLQFSVPTKNGESVFECEYLGKVKIKVRENEASTSPVNSLPIKRPVVLLNVQLGEKVRAVQVNLTNRKRFLYPLLLGRDALIDFGGAVDPAQTFTVHTKSTNKHEH